MSTQKEIIYDTLFQHIAQRADYLAKRNDFPVASVRRVLGELVTSGLARKGRDMFGFLGYMVTKRAGRRAS